MGEGETDITVLNNKLLLPPWEPVVRLLLSLMGAGLACS